MLNEVRLIGNLGQDPRINTNSKGTMAMFSVATTEKWKDKRTGDWQEKTEWHKCVAFGFPAEYAEKNLEKGFMVFVAGSMQYGEYENRDGIKIPTAEVKVQRVKLLSKPQGRGEYAAESEERYPSTGEDVPF